ncbi:MAG: four helix bundle protein [Candidatus Peribacteraceae bacterium]|jgi:four helix bundle protein
MDSSLSLQAQQKGIRDQVSGTRETVKQFTDLDAWKLAHELSLNIYRWTQKYPDNEKYGLVSQMRRAAVSISSNIAEGFGRYSAADKKMFYIIARASCYELESQILISRDLNFLAVDKATEELALCQHVQRAINGLIGSMKQRISPIPRSPIPDSDISL